MQYDNEKLESLIDRTLRGQPPLRAPHTLETRVLNELARRAALPWWRKSFAYWPLIARAAFILACAGLIKLSLAGAAWIFNAVATPVASVQGTARTASSLVQAGEALINALPAQWLYIGAAFAAVMYVALFGLGATAYRILYK
jgi:hypothetical protein